MKKVTSFTSEEEKKSRKRVVTNLLNESGFSIEKIAKVTDVSLDFVKNIQQQLKLLP